VTEQTVRVEQRSERVLEVPLPGGHESQVRSEIVRTDTVLGTETATRSGDQLVELATDLSDLLRGCPSRQAQQQVCTAIPPVTEMSESCIG
jgi:hypothetical protein